MLILNDVIEVSEISLKSNKPYPSEIFIPVTLVNIFSKSIFLYLALFRSNHEDLLFDFIALVLWIDINEKGDLVGLIFSIFVQIDESIV